MAKKTMKAMKAGKGKVGMLSISIPYDTSMAPRLLSDLAYHHEDMCAAICDALLEEAKAKPTKALKVMKKKAAMKVIKKKATWKEKVGLIPEGYEDDEQKDPIKAMRKTAAMKAMKVMKMKAVMKVIKKKAAMNSMKAMKKKTAMKAMKKMKTLERALEKLKIAKHAASKASQKISVLMKKTDRTIDTVDCCALFKMRMQTEVEKLNVVLKDIPIHWPIATPPSRRLGGLWRP